MIHATVIGRLGADSELKFSTGGDGILTMRIATDYKQKDKEALTTWVRATLFGKRAEALSKYLNKGDRVGVRGTLYTREHEGRTYVELRADEVELLGEKKGEVEPAGRYGKSGAGNSAKHTAGSDEEIPF